MASTMTMDGGGLDNLQHAVVVEMAYAPPHPPPPPERLPLESELEPASTVPEEMSDEIAPLLPQTDRQIHKMNIFSVSYPRRKPREAVKRLTEPETSVVPQLVAWTWGGSRYSGVICMALSSSVYYIMGAMSETFSVYDSNCPCVIFLGVVSNCLALLFLIAAQPIPLLQTAFTRCTVISFLSFLCLRRTGQPIFGPANARKLLFARAICPKVTIITIHCLKLLHSHFGFNCGTLRIAEIGGLACSFFGVLFTFRPILATGDGLIKAGETWIYVTESNNFNSILMGLFSSLTGGISYCLIRAGAKASDEPIYTVFLFGLLASPTAAVSTFFFEVALSQLWSIAASMVPWSFSRR
ncbi:hypothetical protein V2J09_015768 [Rumex salicifolius]